MESDQQSSWVLLHAHLGISIFSKERKSTCGCVLFFPFNSGTTDDHHRSVSTNTHHSRLSDRHTSTSLILAADHIWPRIISLLFTSVNSCYSTLLHCAHECRDEEVGFQIQQCYLNTRLFRQMMWLQPITRLQNTKQSRDIFR